MPIYVWKCPECGHEIEEIMKVSEMEEWENIPVVCEGCSKGLYKRDISHGTNFRLKGIGWSADGYENIPPYEPGRQGKGF